MTDTHDDWFQPTLEALEAVTGDVDPSDPNLGHYEDNEEDN